MVSSVNGAQTVPVFAFIAWTVHTNRRTEIIWLRYFYHSSEKNGNPVPPFSWPSFPVLVPVKAEFDQIIEGLSLISTVWEPNIQQRELFVADRSPAVLTVPAFLQLIDYSEQGSNDWEKEAIHWNEFLIEVENKIAGIINLPFAVSTVYSIDGELETRTLTLEYVLVFATGANRIPPTGG